MSKKVKAKKVSTSVRLNSDIMDRIREDASSNLRPLTYQIEWIINSHYAREDAGHNQWTVGSSKELDK